jgi:hypothetical protein
MEFRLCDAIQHVANRMDGFRGNHTRVIITLLMGMTLGSFSSPISPL